jgi:RimJ/RimL family protein N-acetyltransferase
VLLIVAVGVIEVGLVRFARDAASATVGLVLDPAARGRSLAAPVIVAGTLAAAVVWPDLRRVEARIRPENAASRLAFGDAGFGLVADPDTNGANEVLYAADLHG